MKNDKIHYSGEDETTRVAWVTTHPHSPETELDRATISYMDRPSSSRPAFVIQIEK